MKTVKSQIVAATHSAGIKIPEQILEALSELRADMGWPSGPRSCKAAVEAQGPELIQKMLASFRTNDDPWLALEAAELCKIGYRPAGVIKSNVVAADSDLDKVFRPTNGLAMTKKEILDDIRANGDEYSAFSNEWKKVQPPDPAKLTDALMQKFVDANEAIYGDLIQGTISYGDMEDDIHDLLLKLAKKIKKAGK